MPWIFGYGSLMWDPFFPYLRQERAVLRGYHRAFITSFVRIWGRPDAPCAVLGLEPGGICEGVAYEVESGRLSDIEEQLRAFEGEAFKLTRTRVLVEDEEVEATVALSRPSHSDYLGRLPLAERVAMARLARGPGGTCLEYVEKTAAALEGLGIEDVRVRTFLERLQSRG